MIKVLEDELLCHATGELLGGPLEARTPAAERGVQSDLGCGRRAGGVSAA
jgi:hypothetical protein